MSLHECQSANWQQLGFQSALKGKSLNESAGEYGKQCSQKHNVRVAIPEFTKGYDLGLKRYFLLKEKLSALTKAFVLKNSNRIF